MKNLEQIKNDYIRDKYLASHDLNTWSGFQNFFANRHPEWFEQHWEEVMKIYAMECLKLASENAVLFDINSHSYEGNTYYGDTHQIVVDKDSITNEKNIIK